MDVRFEIFRALKDDGRQLKQGKLRRQDEKSDEVQRKEIAEMRKLKN